MLFRALTGAVGESRVFCQAGVIIIIVLGESVFQQFW